MERSNMQNRCDINNQAQEHAHFLQTLLDSIADPIFFKDKNGIYLGGNHAFEKYIGKKKDEFVGKSVFDMSPPDLAKIYFDRDNEVFQNPTQHQTYEAQVQYADGTRHDVIFSKAVYTNTNGEIAGLIGVILDITQRKKLESQLEGQAEELMAINQNLLEMNQQHTATNEELEQANQELAKAYADLQNAQSQLLQQEKMASIGQLAAGVAHEINNPMSFIISNLDSLQKYNRRMIQFIAMQGDALTELVKSVNEGNAAEKSVEILSKLNDAKHSLKIDLIASDSGNIITETICGTDRVLRIVRDLKGFARKDDENRLSDINDGLENTINVVWNEIKYNINLKKEFGDIPLIVCNPGQLNQVFMNLILNAAQAIQTHGEIVVKTWTERNNIFVSIADTGPGIPPEIINRIFEPFFTTKEVGKGTGLGLSIAYDIVKKHGGEIGVASETGKGTTFTVVLPVLPEQV